MKQQQNNTNKSKNKKTKKQTSHLFFNKTGKKKMQ